MPKLKKKADKRALGTWTGFPTKHPSVDNSNVRLGSFTFGEGKKVKTYAIPTMVDGKQLTSKEAVGVAKKHGLNKYPAFDSVDSAETWIQKHHGNISEEGKFLGAGK